MWFFVSSLPFILLVPIFLLPVPLLSCLCSHPFHPPFSPLLLIHHPTCPEFPPPAFISPLLPLCSLFLPTCFIFYCTCFLSSSLVPVAPLFPSLSLFPSFPFLSREEEGAWFARIVRSPAGGPGRPQGAMCFTFQSSYLFTSFHFLISVITVLCQPVINGPTEPRHCYHGYTVSACTCVCSCVYKKEGRNGWSRSSHNG